MKLKSERSHSSEIRSVISGQWELIDEDSSEECLAICAVKGK